MRIWRKLISAEAISNNWKKNYAAFTFLSMIWGEWKDKMKHQVNEILELIMNKILDQHPRVKYVRLMCLELIIPNQTPKIQKNCHSDFVPQIIGIIQDDTSLKIKCIAVRVIETFYQNLI